MEVETKEQEVSEGEQEETTDTSEAETEEESEVSKEPEGEGEENAPKLDEEVKQKIIGDEYAKWQSKTLAPVSKERDDLRKQVSELNSKLEDKADDKELSLLLKADIEEIGEDDAKKLDEIRRSYTAKLKEYRDNKVKVDNSLKDNEGIAEKLGGIERKQMAKEKAYELLLPQDKTFQKQLAEIVGELEQAETPEHMERLLKIIVRERSGNKKPFVPDSGRSGGGGGLNISKMTSDEKIAYGLKKLGRK